MYLCNKKLEKEIAKSLLPEFVGSLKIIVWWVKFHQEKGQGN